MGISEIDPRRWGGTGSWATESAADALNRAPAFGRRFFDAVFQQFPEVATQVHFLRWTVQPDDIYALFRWPRGEAGVQIDPALDYIIVWSAEGQVEFGNWGADQVPPAVEYVTRVMSGKGETAD